MRLFIARILSFLFSFCFMVAIVHNAFAVKVGASASVEIVEPVAFTESLGFETLYIRRSENILKRALGAKKSSENYTQKIPQSEYFISGSKIDAIQIHVVSSVKNNSGVNLDDFVVNYSNNNSNNAVIHKAPGRNASLKLGATLTVEGGTKAGVYEPEFEIGVYYE